jgi:phosphoribosylanthranilate isomerase
MTLVKICGITEIYQAIGAAEAGADYLGLVFAPGRRQISLQKAREIVRRVRLSKSHPALVGVFVNSSEEEVSFIAEACHLDWVQLSGDESWEYCRDLHQPVIKAIHISERSSSLEIIEEVEKGYRFLTGASLICLLDTQIKNAYGGSGQKFDWRLAREVSERFPVMIAGGLAPENVAQLVEDVHPWGVDVSSGVETGGRKDIQKIRDFINIAKGYSSPLEGRL